MNYMNIHNTFMLNIRMMKQKENVLIYPKHVICIIKKNSVI